MATKSRGTRETPWVASTSLERTRLAPRQSGWMLAGAVEKATRTRHGGHGRPSLTKRYRDALLSSESSEWSEESSESSEEEELSFSESSSLSPSDEESMKPSLPVNIIIETQALTETIERNLRCPQCQGPVAVDYKTITLATVIMLGCKDEDCGFIYNSPAPAAANVDDKDDDFKRTTDYAINVLYVLGFLSSGDGGVEAARVLGLLGLPNDTTMETRTLPKIESRIAPKLQKLTQDILLENLTEEAKVSFTDPNDFDQWKEALKNPAFVLGKAK
jgi:hypothetical protein